MAFSLPRLGPALPVAVGPHRRYARRGVRLEVLRRFSDCVATDLLRGGGAQLTAVAAVTTAVSPTVASDGRPPRRRRSRPERGE